MIRGRLMKTSAQASQTAEEAAKKAKTKIVFVEQKKKPLDLRYDPTTIPGDYQLVEYGNKDVIDYLLERSRKSGLPVWTANSTSHTQKNAEFVNDPTKLSYHVGRVGYYFRRDLVAKAQKLYNVALQKGKSKPRGHGQTQKVTKADHEKGLSELYPHMPDRDRQTVIRSLTTKATKIGKATGTMNVYKQIELAVIAHVRHSHTDYEKLIYMSGKVAARSAVESQIAAKLAEWRGEDGQHVDENETELVEYEESTTSESSPSTPVIEVDEDDDYSPPPATQPPQRYPLNGPTASAGSWARQSTVKTSRRSPLLQFGNDELNDHRFEYNHQQTRRFSPPPPPPQRYWQRSQHHSPSISYARVPYMAPPPPPSTFDDIPRVHFRPLPPSPPLHGYSPPRAHEPQQNPWHRPAKRSRADPGNQLPPHAPEYDDYEPPVRMVPYEETQVPLTHQYLPQNVPPDYPRPSVQHRHVPPAFSHHSDWQVPQHHPPPIPTIRYRPLSPNDVIPSRENYSPLRPSGKRARPNDWDDLVEPSRYH